MTEPGPHRFAAEARMMARASPKRVSEFQAGRAAARAALAALGVEAAEILAGDAGEPLWPQGIVGSISHTDRWALAAAARRQSLAALGVDLEADTPLDADLADLVCRPEERAAPPPTGFDALSAAKLRFVAKEAFYKASYPAERRFMEFHDVSVAFDAGGGRFTARLAQGTAAPVAPGVFLRSAGLVCAVCCWS